jgi:phosphoribosylglycinamide formyltransferase 1
MINIAVLVSGGGTNLQALIDAQNNGVIKSGKIALVISSNENAYALERAKNASIKSEVISKNDFNFEDEFDDALLNTLNENDINLVVLAGYMTILSLKVVEAFKNRIINVHPSLIPSFCGDGFYGLKVHEEALRRGVKVTGATVHFVTEVCDGGPILAQKAIEVFDNDTPKTLQERVMKECEWILLPKTTEKICQLIEKGEI